MRPFLALLLLPVALSAEALPDVSRDAGFRWRVLSDEAGGYAIRYPYDYLAPDQYATTLYRHLDIPTGSDGKADIKAMRHPAQPPDLLTFSLPAAQAKGDLGAIGDEHAAGEKLSWTPFDYYQRPAERPQADAKWAPQGVTAVIGEGEKHCALVVRANDRVCGIVATGKLGDFDNRRIFDTFEITKSRGVMQRVTWREAQWSAGAAFGADDAPLKPQAMAAATQAVPWVDAWECETRHYHVTTNVSTKRLADYAALLDALYVAYHGLFRPESFPPYKMEVHVFDTYHNFRTGAAAIGAVLPRLPPGQIINGFFYWPRLCLVCTEESGKVGEAAKVEHVMAHECSHQFLHVTCNGSAHVPTWINEGIAVYFEAGAFANGKFEVKPPMDRIKRLEAIYAQLGHTIRPLNEYINWGKNISADQYGEVFAMLHFWVFGDAKGGRERFQKYWKALKAGEDGGDAFNRIFMTDMIKAQGSSDKAVAAWEKLLLEHVKAGKLEAPTPP